MLKCVSNSLALCEKCVCVHYMLYVLVDGFKSLFSLKAEVVGLTLTSLQLMHRMVLWIKHFVVICLSCNLCSPSLVSASSVLILMAGVDDLYIACRLHIKNMATHIQPTPITSPCSFD